MQLREWMYQNRMTGAEFADLIGYHRNYVYQIVNGLVKPGKKIKAAINKATRGQVTPSDFETKNKKEDPMMVQSQSCDVNENLSTATFQVIPDSGSSDPMELICLCVRCRKRVKLQDID